MTGDSRKKSRRRVQSGQLRRNGKSPRRNKRKVSHRAKSLKFPKGSTFESPSYNKGFDQAYDEGFNAGFAKGFEDGMSYTEA